MLAGRVSWLLLVSVSRRSDRRVSRVVVARPIRSALLSVAAKLRGVARRDLQERFDIFVLAAKQKKVTGQQFETQAFVLA